MVDQLASGARVAVIRLRSMGDCVLTTPAIQILHQSRPDLEIGVVVESRFQELFQGNPAVAKVLEPSYRALWRWHPKLCINYHGGTRSILLTLASAARYRAGFAHHRGAWVYNVRIPRAQQILGEERVVHTAEHLASAMFYLGCPAQEIPKSQLFRIEDLTRNRYAVIHPVSAAAYKTWHAQGFLAAAEHFERIHGMEVVIIGGVEDDLSAFARYRIVAGAGLRDVMSLIGGAAAFFGNDSGPAHIAAAFNVPLVVLYGRVEHCAVWAPWRAERARSLVSPEGIQAITVEEALAAIDEVCRR